MIFQVSAQIWLKTVQESTEPPYLTSGQCRRRFNKIPSWVWLKFVVTSDHKSPSTSASQVLQEFVIQIRLNHSIPNDNRGRCLLTFSPHTKGINVRLIRPERFSFDEKY